MCSRVLRREDFQNVKEGWFQVRKMVMFPTACIGSGVRFLAFDEMGKVGVPCTLFVDRDLRHLC